MPRAVSKTMPLPSGVAFLVCRVVMGRQHGENVSAVHLRVLAAMEQSTASRVGEGGEG